MGQRTVSKESTCAPASVISDAWKAVASTCSASGANACSREKDTLGIYAYQDENNQSVFLPPK